MHGTSYSLIDISTDGGWENLKGSLDDEYAPGSVVARLRGNLDPACARILVEHFYNDKDYRSTYYNFYAKKGYRYDVNCVRLHFFDEQVELRDGLDLRFSRPVPDESYFGYLVLRPTRFNTIGRTVLSPRARLGFHGHIVKHEHKIHVLGHKLHVPGFPYMSQHTDISVCAHTACWAILRHYSERYSRYRELLTYDITRLAQDFDPGGLVPSLGLHLGHAERIFSAAGTFPVVVAKSDDDPESFYRQLFAYVESGFPLFAALPRHAIAVIGHLALTREPDPPRPCTFYWDRAEGLVAIDDNHLPYLSVPRNATGAYDCDAITDFIVPLPDKVYYPAEAVDRMALLVATEPKLGFDPTSLETPVVRYFLTTAPHIREFMHKNRSQFDPVLVATVMELAFPQFLWVIEVASEPQWRAGQVEFRVILDATAGPYETDPVFLMHDAKRAYICDRGDDGAEGYVNLDAPGAAPLSRMLGNLRSY